MKGIELSKAFYNEIGKPMLQQDFSDVLDKIAIGFTGSGSDHYGFDDDISKDHDFEPGFTVFLPDESIIDRKQEFLLERAYAKLPKEFMGYTRDRFSPVGGNRHGIVRISDYYEKAIGSSSGELSLEGWLKIPDYALSEAINGVIFEDNYGLVTKIRTNLENMPLDIKLKRLAGNILIMAQSGEYNFDRCIKHCEPHAASLASVEFINAAIIVFFLLNGKYSPYYKWSFRAMREISGGVEFAAILGDLLDYPIDQKLDLIHNAIAMIKRLLLDKEFLIEVPDTLEETAYKLNDMIVDGEIRNKHILYCI